jgi:hypothetical protein
LLNNYETCNLVSSDIIWYMYTQKTLLRRWWKQRGERSISEGNLCLFSGIILARKFRFWNRRDGGMDFWWVEKSCEEICFFDAFQVCWESGGSFKKNRICKADLTFRKKHSEATLAPLDKAKLKRNLLSHAFNKTNDSLPRCLDWSIESKVSHHNTLA